VTPACTQAEDLLLLLLLLLLLHLVHFLLLVRVPRAPVLPPPPPESGPCPYWAQADSTARPLRPAAAGLAGQGRHRPARGGRGGGGVSPSKPLLCSSAGSLHPTSLACRSACTAPAPRYTHRCAAVLLRVRLPPSRAPYGEK
jgi:hypothetical protein